jgi:elongation factor P--beta-lysine ligase
MGDDGTEIMLELLHNREFTLVHWYAVELELMSIGVVLDADLQLQRLYPVS